MERRCKIAVIGGGSWATAIIKMLSNNVGDIGWWMRNEKTINYIKKYKHNPDYLRSVELDIKKLFISTDIKKVISCSETLIFSVPSAFLKETLLKAGSAEGLLKRKIVFSAIKGIVPDRKSVV